MYIYIRWINIKITFIFRNERPPCVVSCFYDALSVRRFSFVQNARFSNTANDTYVRFEGFYADDTAQCGRVR